MGKKRVYLIGCLMILVGIISTLHFILQIQQLFQFYLPHYKNLFDKGFVGQCLYLDAMMFLYIASLLFKNFYYVIGGVLILFFIEFGKELGVLASFIAFITEVSFYLVFWGITPSEAIAFPTHSILFLLLFFLVGISIPTAFLFCFTRKAMVERLKGPTQ